MSIRVREGIKIGARKVNCEEYTPDVGYWEETNVVWDFGDGWTICEDKTSHDRKLTAFLTKTCLGSGEVYDAMVSDIPDEDYWAQIEKEAVLHAETLWRTPYYEKLYSKRELKKKIKTTTEAQIRNLRQRGRPEGLYRMMHLRDPENRPRACILLLKAEYFGKSQTKNGWYVGYSNSRDLGQTHPIKLGGQEWHVLECRIGTGNSCPVFALERIAHWYAEATGQWDQEAFEKQNPTTYQAVEHGHPTKEQLELLRCK